MNMNMLLLCLLVLNNALFSQTQTAAAVDEKTTQHLQEAKKAIAIANAQWAVGWKERDADKVAAIFADDGVQLSGNGSVIKGRKQIAERQQKQ